MDWCWLSHDSPLESQVWVVLLDTTHSDDVLQYVGGLGKRLAWCDLNLCDLSCVLVGSHRVDGASARSVG